MFLLILATAMGASIAHASEGVIELSQSCAVTTGCVPGDSPGFPITLSEKGAYRLTSNLTLGAGETGVWIQTSSVDLDLRGFGILGASGATGQIPVRFDAAWKDLSIRNGRIKVAGVAPRWVLAGKLVRLTDVRIQVPAFECGETCRLRRVRAELSTAPSPAALLICGQNCTIEESEVGPGTVSSASGYAGVECGWWCMVRNSEITAGGQQAALVAGPISVVTGSTFQSFVSLAGGSVLKGSTLTATHEDLALVTAASVVGTNTIKGRIRAGRNTSIFDSTIDFSSATQPTIEATGTGAVRISGNHFTGTEVSFGGTGSVVDAGNNICGGTVGCL